MRSRKSREGYISLAKRWEDQSVRETAEDTVSGIDYLEKLIGLDPESRATMVKRFAAGQTIPQIAKALDSTDEIIEEGLTMEGVSLPPPGRS